MNFQEYEKLERISDDILQLGRNCVAKFNVTLKKNINNEPQLYHREYEYVARNNKNSVSIKRSYDYYISIENYQKGDNHEKAFIRIGVKEFPQFKQAISTCVAWFTDKKFAKLFVSNKGALSLTAPIPSYMMENLPMGKWLRFEPAIYEANNGDQYPSVRMYLSDSTNFTDIIVDTLVGFNDMISNLNMFMLAQSMVPKITIPFGLNRVELNNLPSIGYKPFIPPTLDIGGVNGRVPDNKKNKSDLSGLEEE